MLTPDQVSQFRTQAGLSPTPPTPSAPQANDIIAQRKAALNGTPSSTTQPTQPNAINSNPLVQAGQNFASQTNAHAANIVQDLSGKPSFSGASDVIGNVGVEGGDILGDLFNVAYQATTPQPVRDAIGAFGKYLASTQAVQRPAQNISDLWGQFAAKNPDLAKSVAGIGSAVALGVGTPDVNVGDIGDAIKTGAQTAGQMVSDAAGSVKNLLPAATDPATEQAIANIAKQEGGIVAPTLTDAQKAGTAAGNTWDIIKPKLTPSQMADAATSGSVIRTGENGVLTQVPTAKDMADIKLAQPYVEAAQGDPIKTAQGIKQGIATEAQQLRDAVGTQGGTFSTSNVKGVMNNVKIPLAIKDTAEMTQVNNIKDYVAELAKGVDKNPQGALDLAQQFRQGINSEFGENIWGKGTPISNYISNANKALNDFIATRLPNGTLPDGTLIKDSFARQSQLYNILDNIQIPKLGDQLVTPTEETPLKVPGSPLSEATKKFGKEHPIIKGVVKGAAKAAGLGTAIRAGEMLVP